MKQNIRLARAEIKFDGAHIECPECNNTFVAHLEQVYAKCPYCKNVSEVVTKFRG